MTVRRVRKAGRHLSFHHCGLDCLRPLAARFSDIVRRTFDTKDDLDKWKAKPLYYAEEFKIVPGEYTLTVVFSSGGEGFG